MLTLLFTAKWLELPDTYKKKNASFNSQVRSCPMMALISNLILRTTLLMMQEVCYMVVQ